MRAEQKGYKYIDKHILDRYLKGKKSTKDQTLLEEWILDLQANEELRKYSKMRWEGMTDTNKTNLPGYDEERIHDRIHHILRLEEAACLQKADKWPNVIRFFTRAAAVLFIPLALFTLFFWNGPILENQSVACVDIYSPLGSRTNFELPDGSTGWLNGGSTLSFPSKFNGKTRTVELTGEAYFDVTNNPKKPFTVLSGDLQVKAYGTSFNVLAYPDDMTMEITLESGIVEICKNDHADKEESLGILAPGERAIVIPGTSYFKKDPVEINLYTAWKDGKLVLRNEDMIQMVKKLNRWYNVNLVIKDHRLDTYNYRATFEDEVLDEVLKILKRTSNIFCKELERERYPDGTYGKRTIELYSLD